jgi:hypothetical protein
MSINFPEPSFCMLADEEDRKIAKLIRDTVESATKVKFDCGNQFLCFPYDSLPTLFCESPRIDRSADFIDNVEQEKRTEKDGVQYVKCSAVLKKVTENTGKDFRLEKITHMKYVKDCIVAVINAQEA